MDNSFENILFLTSFCCMACDGEIASEEVEQLEAFSESEHLFDSLNINNEFNKCLDILNKVGNSFIKSYFQAIGSINLTDDEKLNILNVAVRTILADNKVEYSEVKFFKNLFATLNLSKDLVLSNIPNIEDYWLEDDLSNEGSDYSYFSDSDFSIKAPNQNDIK